MVQAVDLHIFSSWWQACWSMGWGMAWSVMLCGCFSPLPAVQSPSVPDLPRRAGSHGETPVMPGFQELLDDGAWFKLSAGSVPTAVFAAHGQALRATLSQAQQI